MMWALLSLGLVDIAAGSILVFGDWPVRVLGLAVLAKGIISMAKSLR
jgi:hypothetical protein